MSSVASGDTDGAPGSSSSESGDVCALGAPRGAEGAPEASRSREGALETLRGDAVGYLRTDLADKCEALMLRCLQGEVQLLPQFAVCTWHWFHEADPAVDAVTAAEMIGAKGAYLLGVLMTRAEDDPAAVDPADGPADGPADDPARRAAAEPQSERRALFETSVLLLSGVYIHHLYLWSLSVAYATARLTRAARLQTTVAQSTPLFASLAALHALWTLKQGVLVSAAHGAAWYAVWRCEMR